MTKKLQIPEKTSQGMVNLHEEIRTINDLYIRWNNKTLTEDDAFNVIRYSDRLHEIKRQEDFYMRQMEWKMAEFTRNSTPRSENN